MRHEEEEEKFLEKATSNDKKIRPIMKLEKKPPKEKIKKKFDIEPKEDNTALF